MSRRNRIIVKKLRNIVILLMAIIVMIGAYKNIRDSRAEDVIEIDAIAIDNYGYLSDELFKLEATQIGDELYEIELPESVNGKEINQIIKVTLEEPVPEVEAENGVQENASTENTVETTPVETQPDVETVTKEQEETTPSEEIPTDDDEAELETPEADELVEEKPSTEETPEQETPSDDSQTTEPETTTPDSTQNPTESTIESDLEIRDNKIILTKEQFETKQLNIEVTYHVAILETNEQGEVVKNLLSEKTEEERKEIEITEETQVLYSKILKYEDEENQKLVEVRGFLPVEAELDVEEVTQEKLVEIFGQAEIDIAYDIKIVKHITKEVLVDENDPSKGTEEIVETIEINPEEFGEKCEVSIKDVNIKTESAVLHVKDDNKYEKVEVKENTKENITFDADTFSIYAVTTDPDIMLLGVSPGQTQYQGEFGYTVNILQGDSNGWNKTMEFMVVVFGKSEDWNLSSVSGKFSWKTSSAAGGSTTVSPWGGFSPDTQPQTSFKYTTPVVDGGQYYLGFTITVRDSYGNAETINSSAGPFNIDGVAPTSMSYSAFYVHDNSTYKGEWTDKQVATKFTAKDATSGVDKFQYKKSSGSWTNATNGGSISKSGTTYTYTEPWTLKDRNDTYTFRAVDKAGNASSASSSFTVKYDVTPPTKPVITGTNADGTTFTSGSWTNQAVTITASSTDGAGTGVSKYQYSTNGTTWNTMTNATLTYSNVGNYTIYVRAVDGMGFISEVETVEINIDKTKPSFASAEITNVSGTGYDVIVYGVSDDRAGIDRIEFPTWTDSYGQDDILNGLGIDLGDGTWSYRVNTSDHYDEDGWYNTEIYVYDKAGNVFSNNALIVGDDEEEGRIYVDIIPPQIIIDTNDGVVKSGLIRHYDAANNTGTGHSSTTTTWKDLSGHYDATVNGATFTNSNLSFDGVDDWVNAGQVSLSNTVTFETIVELSSIQSGEVDIMDNYEQGGCGIFLRNGTPGFSVYLSGVGDIVALSPDGALNVGEKYYITGTYDGAYVRLYINGELKTEIANSGTIKTPDESTVLAIGCNPLRNSAHSGFMNGKVYNAKVYDRALTQDEIYQNLLTAGVEVSDSGLIRHYDAVNNTGNGHSNTTTTWKDLSGNYDGAISGATFTNSNLSFDGVNDWVNIGKVSLTNLLTLETTIEMREIQEGEIDLLNNYQVGGVGLHLTDGVPNFFVYISSVGDYVQLADPDGALQVGEKYQITGTYDGSSMKLYINGELKNQKAQTGTIKAPGNSTVMAIGTNPKGSESVNNFFNGQVYNAKVYTRALTGYEVYKTAYDLSLARELEITVEEEIIWKKEHAVTVTLSDNWSGLALGANIKYGWSESNTEAPSSYTTANLSYSAGTRKTTFEAMGTGFTGRYYLWVVADDPAYPLKDLHGNSQTQTEISLSAYWFDNTLPTITFNPQQSTEEYKKSQSVTVNIGDSHSGLATGNQVQYQWVVKGGTPSGDGWTTKTISNTKGVNSTSFSVTNSTLTGQYKLYIKVQSLKDIAEIGGNAYPEGEIITSDGYFWLDNAAPTLNVTSTGTETWSKSHTATITVSDVHSGLATGMLVQYGWGLESGVEPTSWENATITSYSAGATTTTFDVTGSGFTGKYYLWVKPTNVKDVLGNTRTGNIKVENKLFYFDNTKPMIEIVQPGQDNFDIVTNGLVRHYDAKNNTGNGHDASATVWKDLSGNYDATIDNVGTGISWLDGDKMEFDEYSHYLDFRTPGSTDELTYELTVSLPNDSLDGRTILCNFGKWGNKSSSK